MTLRFHRLPRREGSWAAARGPHYWYQETVCELPIQDWKGQASHMTTSMVAEANTPEQRTGDPPQRIRLLFWVILGAFSVFFAEVTVGSSMFPFFDPFSVLVTCPLYALHILVLGSIVLRQPRPLFPSLFFAGAILGLYEAYITKVLWSPPWNDHPVMLGGVAIIESMMLVLFYHALMAFIVPLVVAERLLTSSGQVTGTLTPRLARWVDKRWFAVVLAATCGIIQTANSPSLLHTIGSTVSTSGFVLVLVLLWVWATRGRIYLLAELLPRGWELGSLTFLLATQYIGLGILLRPEKLPGIGPQAAIWVCYAVFFALLLLSLRRPMAPSDVMAPERRTPLPWQRWLVYSFVFAGTSTACQPLAVFLKIPIFVVLWVGGIIVGCVLLIVSVWRTFRPGRITAAMVP